MSEEKPVPGDDNADISEERRRRNEELFGDLEDLDETAGQDTVESLRAGKAEITERVDFTNKLLAEAEGENRALKEKQESFRQSVAQAAEALQRKRKESIDLFTQDILPAVGLLQENLRAVPQADRDADPKFNKILQGVEGTLSNFSALFNKAGASTLSVTPVNTAENKEPVAEPTIVPPAAAGDETVETLRAEKSMLEAQFIALSARLTEVESENKSLASDLEEYAASARRDVERLERDARYALEKFLRNLLPVTDAFAHALQSISPKLQAANPHLKAVAEELQGTLNRLSGVFNKHGIEEINPLNQPFDESKHEAIGLLPADGVESETVVQVAKKGYALGDRLVRPAQVFVTP